ncbi:MAG: phenylalanine--tRNA ligase subunit alpha [Patescibacteria group bacterium]
MDINNTSESFKLALNKIDNLESLENLRVKYLGRKGLINSFIENLKKASVAEKKELGNKINNLKKEIESSIESKKAEVLQENEDNEAIDATLPGDEYPKGSLHPTTTSVNELIKIFQKIGFTPASYPEVEWEYFAFDALNMPKDHPARDDFETFFLDSKPHEKFGKMILTPHTSSGQIREMHRLKNPPIRMINIAKCYRPNWDTVHTPMFHQFEGMCVDEDISIVNLKGTIDYFVAEFFSEKRKTRLRPFHFQFTEPSFEIDISCGVCDGSRKVAPLRSGSSEGQEKLESCKVCKSGWLELGGAGMIHPNVLKESGIDPDKFSGWAFGFGVERVYMMKEGLNLDDIRILYSGQTEFLNQF